MGILRPAVEARVRKAVERALPDRCTIRRVAQPVTGGAWTDTPSDFAIDIPCRVDKDQRYEREALLAGRLTTETSFVLLLSAVASRWPGGVVDVHATDVLVVTGDGAGTYEVLGEGGPVTDEYVREVRVKKVS